MPSSSATTHSESPQFIAGDLALDFLNTAFGVEAGHRECLRSDADVREWLARAGLPVEVRARRGKSFDGELLRAALALRETARRLVQKRKEGSAGDPAALNRVLAYESAYRQLVWKRGRSPTLEVRDRRDCIEALLVPIAVATARLLAEGDFALVRKCESPICTLWFYDRTRSHQRRWCSMAVCGNRAKVAAFRARGA